MTNFPLAQITDYEALEKISTQQIESYLLKKGWKLIQTNRISSAWKSQCESSGVLVPKTREVADYSYRIGDCIRTLAAYEKRSQINVWLEMTDD